MSLLPWVQKPCPVLDRLDAMMDGDVCRLCNREVHDITGLDYAERAAFFEACNGNACVRYRFEAGPALAAALIAASAAVAIPAAATPQATHHSRHVPHPPRLVSPPQVEMVTAGVIALPPAPPRQPEAPPVKSKR